MESVSGISWDETLTREGSGTTAARLFELRREQACDASGSSQAGRSGDTEARCWQRAKAGGAKKNAVVAKGDDGGSVSEATSPWDDGRMVVCGGWPGRRGSVGSARLSSRRKTGFGALIAVPVVATALTPSCVSVGRRNSVRGKRGGGARAGERERERVRLDFGAREERRGEQEPEPKWSARRRAEAQDRDRHPKCELGLREPGNRRQAACSQRTCG
ncbi:hypothetical protein L1887_53343 [Cichorium endivia]|nr:hypothetical protein L1887_53343 [Cichorium endivia]